MEIETMDELINMEIEQNKLNEKMNNKNNTKTSEDYKQKYNFRKDDDINFILCPLCNAAIKPNPANMCVKCLNDQVDISDGISKQIILFDCRQCGRYYANPNWVDCPPESAQLLQLCLKKLNGLKKVKLINAEFVWTEPHSRRIKVKLTIQKEVFNHAIVEKTFEVDYLMANQQCKECEKSFTHHQWEACIQIRQKTDHKKTFLYLEQLILKHNMGQLCLGITEQKDGIDFFFTKKSVALSFLSFLHSIIIFQTKESKKLISYDHKSNIAKHRFTIYGEIPSVNRNDLVLIPINKGKLTNKLGGFSPLMICYKVTKSLHFLDPISLHTIELDNHQYFRYKFDPLCTSKHLTQFYVMKIDRIRINKNREYIKNKKWKLAEIELCRYADLGDDNAELLESITHLGGLLREGDVVLGYDLKTLSIHDNLMMDKSLKKYVKKNKIYDVIIVKKHYPKRKKRRWELKSMVMDKDYVLNKKMKEKEENDKEEFMRELEEDFEYRCKINLYKKMKANPDAPSSIASGYSGDPNDYAPVIPVTELVSDLTKLNTNIIHEENEEKVKIIDNNNNNNNNNNDNDSEMKIDNN